MPLGPCTNCGKNCRVVQKEDGTVDKQLCFKCNPEFKDKKKQANNKYRATENGRKKQNDSNKRVRDRKKGDPMGAVPAAHVVLAAGEIKPTWDIVDVRA